MKTSTFNTLLVALSSLLFIQQGYADAGAYITVKGAQSFDQMWIFSNANCTRGFDNGWDGYKMIASPVPVQLYAAEAAGNFQVDAVPDFNNTYLAFKAGADTVYTLTFIYQELELYYQHLYLIDSVANKVVDIYTAGTQYTFTASNTTLAIKRFKIVTINPTAVVEPVIVEPVIVEPVVVEPVVVEPVVVKPEVVVDTVVVPEVVVPDDVVVEPVVVEPVVVVDPVVVEPTKDKKDKKNKDENEKNKKIKIYSNNKTIVVENSTKQKGQLTVYNAKTGKMVKSHKFNADGVTYVSTDLKKGTYIANATTAKIETSITLIIR